MRIFLIAGEPSGDSLGQAVMAGLKALLPEVEFDGVGGPKMQSEGLISRFEMSELSVMGIAEVLPKYFHLKRRIAEMAEAVMQTRPDVVLTIDSPDFCLRVAKLVKAKSGVRTIHYVAPSVWAWRPGRADKMARVIDHVLALLPFEPPLMQVAGMTSDFVGHPIVAEPIATDDEAQGFRREHGIEDTAPLVLVLPGSRKGEVGRMAPVFGKALQVFQSDHPRARTVLVAAPAVEGMVREKIESWSVPAIVISGGDLVAKRAAFRAADLALAASGTVSLELAAADTPMVIGYKMNPLSYRLIRSMALIDTVTLVNIVTKTRVIPECLGPGCTPEALAGAMAMVHDNPASQIEAFAQTMQMLGKQGEEPGMRAARSVLAHAALTQEPG